MRHTRKHVTRRTGSRGGSREVTSFGVRFEAGHPIVWRHLSRIIVVWVLSPSDVILHCTAQYSQSAPHHGTTPPNLLQTIIRTQLPVRFLTHGSVHSAMVRTSAYPPGHPSSLAPLSSSYFLVFRWVPTELVRCALLPQILKRNMPSWENANFRFYCVISSSKLLCNSQQV
jgi:hypothetical protein